MKFITIKNKKINFHLKIKDINFLQWFIIKLNVDGIINRFFVIIAFMILYILIMFHLGSYSNEQHFAGSSYNNAQIISYNNKIINNNETLDGVKGLIIYSPEKNKATFEYLNDHNDVVKIDLSDLQKKEINQANLNKSFFNVQFVLGTLHVDNKSLEDPIYSATIDNIVDLDNANIANNRNDFYWIELSFSFFLFVSLLYISLFIISYVYLKIIISKDKYFYFNTQTNTQLFSKI